MSQFYQHLYIYYFSGTGNAKNASAWFSQTASDMGVSTKVFDISKPDSIEYPAEENCLIGIFSPTHGFNLPPIMLKFIRHFPKGQKQSVFILNTRAGMKLHKLFLPGLSGAAQILPALMLRLKKYRMVGYQPMDLPSNWISIHPGIKPKVVESIYTRCEKITKKSAKKLLSGQKIYKGFISLPIDLLILPITFLYYIIGRFALAKTFVATKSCNSCGLCVKKCPVQAIKFINNHPYWKITCESCMRCINACAKRSIQTAHGFTFAIWFAIMYIVTPAILTNIFPKTDFLASFKTSNQMLYGTFEFIIKWSIALTAVVIGYKLLHLMVKISPISFLIRITSLTHFKFWRRYKIPKQFNDSIKQTTFK